MSIDPFEKWICEACKQKIDTSDERALEYYQASGLRFFVYCYADNVPREPAEDLLDAAL